MEPPSTENGRSGGVVVVVVGGVYLDVVGDVDLAGPQVAQARLFDQLAALVGVGDPEGQAAAAALGAGAP